jgi:hypothetical protein
MKVMFALAAVVLLMLAAALVSTQPALAQACSNKVFCGGWLRLCTQIGGRGDVCGDRYKACLSSGCFYFSSPRPRCKNNPEDMKLTTACQR